MRTPNELGRSFCRLLMLAALPLVASPTVGSITEIEFLGQARIPGGLIVEETVVGGLSGITYDAAKNLFYAVADDPSARASARLYVMKIDLSDGHLADDGATVLGKTVIQAPGGGPMPPMTVDPEGIALHPDGSFYISSEGQIKQQVAPFVRRFTVDGQYLGDLPLAPRYLPHSDGLLGPRHNRGFESLTVTPDGSLLFTAVENALIQDGPEAELGIASPNRLLKFALGAGELEAEYLYMTEPVAVPSSVPDGMEVNGLVDLLALDEENLLAMERSYSMGVGNTIGIYLVSLRGATDIQSYPALAELELAQIEPVRKELLLDLTQLGIYLDNLEGMSLGPVLEDGRRSLILVSDDNFNPLIQTTQIFAFAFGDRPTDVERIQGAAHRSSLEGRWVRSVEGVITALYPGKESAFWMESTLDDGDPATSRGILVLHEEGAANGSPGDRVRVDGRVVERQRPGELSTTMIQSSRVQLLEQGAATLPPPLALGRGSRVQVPTVVVDDDGLQVFEPRFDGLDFWESLEGMRITLEDARVVGPTTRYGDVTVDASGGPTIAAASRSGGLMLRPGDLNPERLIVDFSGVGEAPNVDVGARFVGDLEGVIGYRFSRYRLFLQSPPPVGVTVERQAATTQLTPGETRLTIATFNVHNLSARSHQDHFRSLAQALTESLRGPDIVALQEIQDDTGVTDDGVVTATATLEHLVDAVARSGGPVYQFLQIDPENNRDGGQPGSNIRVAFLFNPRRVSFQAHGQAGPFDAIEVVENAGGVGLSVNPGRIQPRAPAFNGDEARGFSASRKPLVAEFRFGDERLFLVNNHWSSKGTDDRVFGDSQPPIRRSEDQRSLQARLVVDFVEEILRVDPEAGVVVLGDLNDHEFRSPLQVLTAAGLENLVLRLPLDDRYSYNYYGDSQLLDYILLSRPLLERVRVRLDIVHANSDLHDAVSSSDHDPLVVELDFSQVE